MSGSKETIWERIGDESGLSPLYRSSWDAKLFCLQRFVRLFAFSGSALILALFLDELGASQKKIGLFMTLTLLGDVLLSILFTFIADRFGRRNVLGLGSIAMIASGVIFGLSNNFWLLLVGATIGVISPSANEVGPFRAIEESILTQLTPLSERGDIFSWYSSIGIFGQALGTLACGWLTQLLETKYGYSRLGAYRVVFFVYAGLGLIKLLLTVSLSSKCELEVGKHKLSRSGSSEEAPLLNDGHKDRPSEQNSWLGFSANRESFVVLGEINFLQALEAISMGLVVTSWIAYYFNEKFNAQEGTLGIIFLASYLLQASSNVVAASIAKRLGVIKTMAIVNLVGGMTIAIVPLPHNFALAVVFFMFRSCTNVIGLRTAFVATMFLPAERTAFMGITNVVRTSGQSVGPIVTGALAGAHVFWVAFVLAGGIVAAYGFGLWALFEGREARAEKKQSSGGTRDDADNSTSQRSDRVV